jgi:uncharacterized protein involved in type VI secretion and phage assembly
MKPLQETKIVGITPPAAIVDNASYTTTTIDTLGYGYATIVAYLGATDIAMTALKVQESDDSGMSGAADVTGLVVGTSLNISGVASALPSATDDNKFMIFEVSLQGRKRYLDLVATAGDGSAGTFLTAFAILSQPVIAPATIAARGADEILRV